MCACAFTVLLSSARMDALVLVRPPPLVVLDGARGLGDVGGSACISLSLSLSVCLSLFSAQSRSQECPQQMF